MALDWLLDPVTAEAPCGPDLEKNEDEAFLDYYFEAEARLPERYFTPGVPGVLGGAEDRLFDPKSVHLRRETEELTRLLQRSRDLRLLALLARFQILAGRVGDFATSIEAIAALIEARKAEVHPQVDQGTSERRGALDALAEPSTVVMPLMHLPLAPRSSYSYRTYLVATGAATPRQSEDNVPEVNEILAALRNPAELPAVRAQHDDLTRAALGLRRITAACMANGAASFTPNFGATLDIISELQRVVIEANPDWRGWKDQAPAQQIAETAPISEAEPSGDAPIVAAPLIESRAHHIADHAMALSVIQSAERYLAQFEPSSLSLLLVAQANQLFGKSIVDALELLMPEDAPKAELTLGKDIGFTIDMARMRQLSQAVSNRGGDSIDATQTKPVVIKDRNELADYLRGVEEFYLRKEPASPIPVLLGGARNLLTKTFHAIVSEIISSKPVQG